MILKTSKLVSNLSRPSNFVKERIKITEFNAILTFLCLLAWLHFSTKMCLSLFTNARQDNSLTRKRADQ